MRALPEVAAATGFAELLWTIEFTSRARLLSNRRPVSAETLKVR
jgi:hypothetical protein